jgi:DNA-binding NarL/FixJ family response regulator
MDADPPPLLPIAAIFGGIALLVAIDLASDLSEGVEWSHAAVEGTVIALSSAGAAWLLAHLRRERAALTEALRRADAERQQLDAAAARWKAQAADAARGFAQAVEAEFERWGLTAAEREVAMLLLKGMSLKDIADARGTSERTVRQQATVVYAKAGVAGRTELASYFLDALP